jgi:hypothetical protein
MSSSQLRWSGDHDQGEGWLIGIDCNPKSLECVDAACHHSYTTVSFNGGGQ